MRGDKRKTEPGARSAYQSFEAVEVHRREIKNAPYNPRSIHERARKLLRENLKRVGLVDPPVWNARTGNLVGGHQRLACLDALEGSDDYTLTVAKVDLDEKTEKEQNIFLNNPAAQGEWDLPALQAVLKEVDTDLAGFSAGDVYQLFGDSVLADSSAVATALAEQIQHIHERYNAIQKTADARDDDDFYNLLIWKSNAERAAFMKAIGLPDNRYLDGRLVAEKLKAVIAEPEPAATPQ